MTYKCPKGHDSTDADYCSECGALIGKSKVLDMELVEGSDLNKQSSISSGSQELCPDCGTPRVGDTRFCEVCRHDFQDNKTGIAEVIVAAQANQANQSAQADKENKLAQANQVDQDAQPSNAAAKEEVVLEKLNVVITVDKDKASSCDIETTIKPDSKDRVFPLDLDENLVGRRSNSKGIYPEIEISDPGVSHRHLKFIKQTDGRFAVLELGSANGTELNGAVLEPGINTPVKAGDELAIGIWTILKIVSR